MSTSPVVAICVSDVHLSLVPPIARAEEKDWLRAQERPWKEIKTLQEKWSGCPILCAGDLFDKYQNPAELVNWAIDILPPMYSIAGNHDLPNHSPSLVDKSSYGTLVRARKLIPLTRKPTYINELALYGTTLGKRIPPPIHRKGDLLIHILLIHKYIWMVGCGYQGAPQEHRLSKVAQEFKGYDVVVVGDNHIGFSRKLKSGTSVFNCGTLLRRKSDEARLRPQVGLVHLDGKVTPYYLDTSKDVMTELVHDDVEVPDKGVDKLLAELEATPQTRTGLLDFRETLKKVECSTSVRKLLLESIEDA